MTGAHAPCDNRPMSDAPRIHTETRGPLHLIGLARPAKRNAFDLQMLRELAEALTLF